MSELIRNVSSEVAIELTKGPTAVDVHFSKIEGVIHRALREVVRITAAEVSETLDENSPRIAGKNCGE